MVLSLRVHLLSQVGGQSSNPFMEGNLLIHIS
jgi:hypothetical protein